MNLFGLIVKFLLRIKMISLKISEIHARDAGKCYARISEKNMSALGIGTWDLVELGGKRKTVVRAIPLEEKDYDNGEAESVIEIDFVTRENVRSEINEVLNIKKAKSRIATRVTLCPKNNDILYSPDKFKLISTRLEGIPLTTGDKVSIKLPGMLEEEFEVLNVKPTKSVVVKLSTKFEVKKKPVGKIDTSRLSYDDIGGLENQINKIREMIELPLRFPEVFEKLGIIPPKGVLLIGSPGSGKTLLVKAIASETNANFQVINGPEIIHKFYGESEARIRKIFDVATKNQPSIIFIDELDAIAPKRDKVSGEVEKRVVSQLLTLMDGLRERGNVIVIGATNIPEAVDPALRRPGRFDREINLGVPDHDSRVEILKIHSRSMPLSEDLDFERLGELTQGYVGADLENLCKEAAMVSLRRTIPDLEFYDDTFEFKELKPLEVNIDDFLSALKDINPSAIWLTRFMLDTSGRR